MKRKILISGVVAALLIGGFGFTKLTGKDYASDRAYELILENAEALAASEGSSICGGPKVNNTCLAANTIPCGDSYGCK